MNYDQPRPRKSDGRWDMTSRNDDRIHAVGYCAGASRADPRTWNWDLMYPGSNVWREKAMAMEIDRFDRFAVKYHDDGHSTEIGASDCYREYRLDQKVHCSTYQQANKTIQLCEAAEECRERSVWSVIIDGYTRETVCESHRTRETFERLIGPAGQVYASVHS